MLVLTRKKSESIRIGDGIEITVVEITSNQVRIGIRAPKNMTIYRSELYEAIREESRESTEHIQTVTLMKDQLKELFKDAEEKTKE